MLSHRHNQKVTSVYQRWPCPLSQFLNKPRIRTQNLMKQAVPYAISSRTAGRIGPCPSILPGKKPSCFNPQWCNSFVTPTSFFPVNSQINWAGKDTRWIHSDTKSGNADSHKAQTLSIHYSKRLIDWFGKSILNLRNSLSGLFPFQLPTFRVLPFQLPTTIQHKQNCAEWTKILNPLLSHLCLQLKIQLMFYPYYSQGKLWNKI